MEKLEKVQYLKNNLDIDFYPHLLDETEAKTLYNELESRVPWPRIHPNKRSNVTYGDTGLTYKIEWYGKTTYRKATPWNQMPILLDIKGKAEAVTGTIYNICVVQRYPSGHVGIKSHRDKEMTPGTTILGLSLGATRTLRMTGKGDNVTLKLNEGSVYCLNPPTNDFWSHSILEDETKTPRISLTFRNYCSN